jgi:hypothetical protein
MESGCPTVDTLHRYLKGELTGQSESEVVDHVEACEA